PLQPVANATGNSTITALSGPVNLGSFVSAVSVTSRGSGYTSAPTVTLSGGGGSGATATAIISGGVVTSVRITNGGSGCTSAPTVSFTGGGGSGAAATAVVGGALSGDNNSAFQFTGGTAAIALPQLATGATVASVFLTSGGSGYSSAPTVTFG